MNIASLEDVNRLLGFTTGDDEARDARVRASLAAVESWLDGRLLVAPAGPGVQIYHDVSEDATLRLPAKDVVVTKVRLLGWGGSEGGWWGTAGWFEADGDEGYDLTEDGDLILRPSAYISVAGLPGAVASRALRTYDRVEVHYEGTGVVPRHVSEGVAWLAAGHYSDGPTVLSDVVEEKIGDYSYKTGRGSEGGGELGDATYATRAAMFLKGSLKRRRVSVT